MDRKRQILDFSLTILILAIRQLSQHELSQMNQGFAVVNVSGLRLELDLAGIEERFPETIFADPGKILFYLKIYF